LNPQKKKLRASSLVETLIAMTILLVLSALAFTFFAELNAKSFSAKKLEAGLLLKRYSDSTRQAAGYYTDSWHSGAFSLSRTVLPYAPQQGVLQITFVARTERGDSITSRRELVLAP